MPVTYERIKSDPEINTYIRQADESMRAMGFTEHSFAHVAKCAQVASGLLTDLGYPEREVELAPNRRLPARYRQRGQPG